MENIRHKIVYQTAQAIVVAYLGFVLTYVLNWVLARAFHVAVYGDIKFGLSVMNTLSLFIILGLTVLTKKVYPVFVKHRDVTKQAEYRSWSFSLMLKSSIVLWAIFVTVLVVLMFFEQNLWEKIGNYHVAIWFIAISPIVGASSLVTSFMYAVRRGVLNKFFISIVLVVLITVLLLLLGALLEGGLKQYHVVFIYLACYLLIIVIQYRYVLRFSLDITIKPMRFLSLENSQQRHWFYQGVSFLWANVMFILLMTLDLVILELVSLVAPFIHNEGEVGLYAAALVVARLFYTVQIVCFSLLASFIASFHQEEGGDAEINQLLSRLSLLAMGFQCVALLVLLFFGKRILAFYGSEYVAAYPVMMVLVLGFVVRFFMGGMSGQVLIYLGHQKLYNTYTAALVVIYVPMTFALAFFFGMMGVAVANVIIFFLHTGCNRFFLAKKSTIKPLGFI